MIGLRAEPCDTLRQGDIILAPAAVLVPWSREPGLALAPEDIGRETSGALWDASLSEIIPPVGVVASYIPVMVLSHDCELEKEFNERVVQLIEEGLGEGEAVDRASKDPTLDPFAAVAPVVPLDAYEARRHQGILQGQRIGIFPVPELPHEPNPFAVDLFRVATVSRSLLSTGPKVASLDEFSGNILRFKLSEAYASRDLSTIEALNQALGARVTKIEALPSGKKKTSLVVHLEGREALHLDIRAPRKSMGEGVERKP